jgi:hypothetical protein
LRESHDEDEVNGDEAQQVPHYHSVNHDDERPDSFESTAKEKEIRRGCEHHDDRELVLDLVGAGDP